MDDNLNKAFLENSSFLNYTSDIYELSKEKIANHWKR